MTVLYRVQLQAAILVDNPNVECTTSSYNSSAMWTFKKVLNPGPKGYGLSAVLVINRVSILADFSHIGHK